MVEFISLTLISREDGYDGTIDFMAGAVIDTDDLCFRDLKFDSFVYNDTQTS